MLKKIILLSLITFSVYGSYGQGVFKNVAVINTHIFQDEKAGVVKLIELQRTITNEFKPKEDEIQKLRTRYDQLAKEVTTNPSASDAERKREEADRINRDVRRLTQEISDSYQKRYQQLSAPIYQKMNTLYQSWCAQKGFSVVIDISKDDKGIISWADPANIKTLTAELISYLNSSL